VDATVTVEYAAAVDCPSDADFWRSFSSRARAVRADRGEWKLVVTIDRANALFSGTIRIERYKQEPIVRGLDDVSCANVATGLAVVAAIAIETAPRVERPELPFEESQPPAARASAWSFRVGANLPVVTSWLAPDTSLGFRVFAEIENRGTSLFEFRVRMGAHLTENFPGSQHIAFAQSTLGFIELGGVRLRVARVIAIRGALFTELGLLRVTGRNVDMSQTAPRFLADLGAMLRVAWEPSAFFIEGAFGGAIAPTVPSFNVDQGGQSILVWQVPRAGVIGEIGLGMRLF